MNPFFQDLKSGLRILRKSPGSALLALAVLALGLGMNAAMFSIVDGIVWKGLPIEGADRLMHLDASRPGQGLERMRVTLHEYLDWQDGQSSFESLHAFWLRSFFVSGLHKPVPVDAAQMTPGAFASLGVQPALGRELHPDDTLPGAENVAIVGHGFWQSQLAGDAGAVGREIRIDGRPFTVVGVMPESFRFPKSEQLWLPLPMDRSVLREDAPNNLHVFGRLKEGVSRQAAISDLTVLCRRMAAQYPETDADLSVLVDPYGRFFIGEDQIALIWACSGAAIFLMLIACANVANLLLARASDRVSEMALRLSFGAGPRRIVGQVLSETLVLTALAAPAGLALAHFLIRLFNTSAGGEPWPFWLDVQLDGTTFFVLAAATLAATLLTGLAPAVASLRVDLSTVLGDRTIGSRSTSRLSGALVVSEVAMSCALMIGAGLVVESIDALADQGGAVKTENVLAAQVLLFEAVYPDEQERRQFWSLARDRVEALAGVAVAGISDYLPGVDYQASQYYFAIDDTVYEGRDQPYAGRAAVSHGWLEAMGVAPLRGRLFTAGDRADSRPVALVTDSFARRHWGEEDPLGRSIRLGAQQTTTDPWRVVVGVVPDLRDPDSFRREDAHIFVPLAQSDVYYAHIVARTHRDPGPSIPGVEESLYGVSQDVALYQISSFEDLVAQLNFVQRTMAVLFSTMALIGLLLAGTGLYGVLSFFISKRTAEAGLRAALGADRLGLVCWIAGHGLKHVGLGLLLGLLAAVGLARIVADKVPTLPQGDPSTFAFVIATLLLVGLISTIPPAWRATRVDPAKALRQG